MKRSLVHARPDQKLTEAEQLLIDHRITGMPVIAGTKLVGIISNTDVARARVLAGALDGQVRDELNWDETQADGFQHPAPEQFEGFSDRYEVLRVRDAMRTQVVTCSLNTPIAQVAAAMVREHLHRIIVLDSDKPVGIISSLDLVRLVAEGK